MAEIYPEPIDLDAVSRRTGFEGARVRQAIWELVDRQFVDVDGSPAWAGLPWSPPRLTAAGMAVACGLISVEDDAREAAGLLDAVALAALRKAVAARSLAAARSAPASWSGFDEHALMWRV